MYSNAEKDDIFHSKSWLFNVEYNFNSLVSVKLCRRNTELSALDANKTQLMTKHSCNKTAYDRTVCNRTACDRIACNNEGKLLTIIQNRVCPMQFSVLLQKQMKRKHLEHITAQDTVSYDGMLPVRTSVYLHWHN